MRLLVDIDGTIANLLPEWLRLYNQDYQDNLQFENVTEWGLHKLVVPSCGTKIYDYLKRPDLYDNVLPIPGAQEGIEKLRRSQGHKVVFASAGIYTVPSKFAWLQKHGFDPGKDAENYIVAYDKAMLRGDLLIDDRDKNILDFSSPYSIIFDAPYNRELHWYHRAHSWEQVVEMVAEIGSLRASFQFYPR